MDTSAADTPAKPIKGEKKTPAKDSPTKAAKPEGTPAKPAKAEGTPAKPAKAETPAKEVRLLLTTSTCNSKGPFLRFFDKHV